MKRNFCFWIGLTITAGLFFYACGAKTEFEASINTIGPDFFTQEIKGEITVSAYETMLLKTYLEEAAKIFESRYPGTKINIETFSAMPVMTEIDTGDGNMATMSVVEDDPQAKTDYLNRLNTRIMSGSGADIFAMDIIPLLKFIEAKTLENLSPYINQDPGFSRADYRENIFDSLTYRNGIWFMPMTYDFTHFTYDSTLIPQSERSGFGLDRAWNSRDLLDYGLPFYDNENLLHNTLALSGGGDSPLFRQFFRENYHHFINIEDKRANFTDGEFTRLLEYVKFLKDNNLVPGGYTSIDDMDAIMRQYTDMNSIRVIFKSGYSISLMNIFYRKAGMEFWGGGGFGGIEDDDEIAGIQALNDGSVPFRDYYSFGINSQSKNKILAWTFLKFLLSEEMQLSPNMYIGYPLNNKARDNYLKMIFTMELFGMPEPVYNEQQTQAMMDFKAAVELLSDSIDSFLISDTYIYDMVNAEVEYYFTGARNAEEVARVLQNKVSLYLAE